MMKMHDHKNPSPLPPETAQPFLYAPPSGDAFSGPSGTAARTGNNRQESAGGHLPSDQSAKKNYEQGLLDGKVSAREDFEKEVAGMRSEISSAMRSFANERTEYFGRVESEVVRLSLSIAKKILHRESQIDPLVLTGVVHVALEKLDSNTRVRLCAHPDEVRLWNDYFRHSKDLRSTVEVLGDPSLSPGHCTLETDLGSTEISLDTQLKEIEQGFFDLLEQRPKGGL
jgi:flagellar assembly protein FliH